MEGSTRGRKRKVRKLTTNGSCFLCLQTCEIKMEGETEEISKPNVNLGRLLRYLQISVSENTSKIEAEMDVEVDLCESCGKLHDKFTTLFQNLKKLLMELNFNLNEIHRRISNSEKIPELVQIYSEEVISGPETLKLMGQLRKDIACKSLSKSSLKVNLTRATLPHVAVVVQNAPETDPLEDIHFEDPISPPQPDPLTFSETEEDPLGPDSPCNPKTKKTPKKGVVTSSKIKKCKRIKDSRMFRCTYDQCHFQSRYQNSVYAHYNRIHLKKTPKPDPQCKPKTNQPRKQWPFKKTYRDIYWKQDPETGLIHCTKCEKTARQTQTVITHYETVHLQKEYKCNFCNTVFTWLQTLKAHEKNCQQNLEKKLAKENKKSGFKFACLFCEKRFETRARLSMHEASVHTNNEHSCEICGKKFKSLPSQQQHTNIIHLGKRFTCQFCNKQYRSENKYIKHRRSCTETKAAPAESTSHLITAPQAPASAASEVQACLKEEIEEEMDPPAKSSKIRKCIMDKDSRMFHCAHDQCDFQSRHKTPVHDHYNKVHLKKRHKCEKCKKAFSYRCALTRHQKICGVVKNRDPPVPVFCELCGKSFQTQEILNCHQILEHKDSEEVVDPPETSSKIIKYFLNEETKMFQCSHDECDFQSRHKPVVHAHYGSVHLKIKPKCENCGKVFAFPCGLSQHKRLYCRQILHKDSM